MRNSHAVLAALIAFGAGCTSAPEPPKVAVVQKPKPADESRRFPKTNLVETKVVDSELLGKKFMPGGTIAHYKKGAVEYDLFLAKSESAALLLPDWQKALTDAKLVPSFGGYFGSDGGRPVFVFSKGNWIAGVAGLGEKDADGEARGLANRIE
jgi:hypothetical protein